MRKRIAALIAAFLISFAPASTAPVIIDQVATAEKIVALTIEDVDNASQLEEILNLLAKENAKATFFIPGRSAAELPLRKIVTLGHELGNHSMNHGYWGKAGQGDITRDVADAANVLQKATGKWPQVIRPPYDWYGDSFFQAAAALPQPCLVIRGAETGDWLADSPEAMLGAARQAAKPGAILNINMRFKAAGKALPRIVHQLSLDGYRVLTVSELIKKEKVPEPPKPVVPVEPPKAVDPPKIVKIPVPYDVFNRLPTNAPYVALTFDDSGSAWQVKKILDILRETGVKATFFLLGQWAEANPDLVRLIAADGHEVANHTYSHPYLAWLNEDEIRNEIGTTQQILKDLSGTPVRLFRPPYGSYNSSVVGVVREMGFGGFILWDVDSRDWTGSSAGTMVYRVEGGVTNGSIVLFHLHGANTAAALNEIIPDLKERGYMFTTISSMLVN